MYSVRILAVVLIQSAIVWTLEAPNNFKFHSTVEALRLGCSIEK